MLRTRFHTAPSAPDDGGFTLVELVITVGILLTVVGSLLGVFESVQQSEGFVADRSSAIDQLRQTVDRMTKELRQASSLAPTSTASTADIMTFVQGQAKHVVYQATGTTLTRKVGAGAAVVVQKSLASTSVFGYEPSVSDGQVVTITLTVHPANRPDTNLVLNSEASLRNRSPS